MKKLLIALSAVVVATVSQAAAVDWSIGNNAWTLNNDTKPVAGYTVYLINGGTALDTIAKAIDGKTGEFNASQTWVFGNASTDNGKGRVSETTTTTDKLTRGTSYDFSVLIIDATNTSDIRYIVSGTSSMAAYSATDGDEAAGITFGSDSFGANALTYNATTAANGWAAVPEPTSGLLMLLGMAGLALRRRRV